MEVRFTQFDGPAESQGNSRIGLGGGEARFPRLARSASGVGMFDLDVLNDQGRQTKKPLLHQSVNAAEKKCVESA